MLVRHRYGVLVFDRRGEGRSEGDFNILGWSGVADLRAAFAFLRGRSDVDADRIGGLGLSVGGEMLLQAAAQGGGVRAVASEGAGVRSLKEQWHRRGFDRWAQLPQSAVLTAATAVFADDAPPPDLMDLVPRIAPRPLLLAYARHGQGGEDLNPGYHARAGKPKALWELRRGGHTDGLSVEPTEYERRVVGFFDLALLNR
jgi:dienelactone hydrolase